MASTSARPALALVVLGGALVRSSRGHSQNSVDLRGAIGRRVRAAAREWARAGAEDPEEDRPRVLIVTGGRSWDGEVEADAMAAAIVALGVPAGVVVRERASLDTRDNARFTAACCARRGIGRVAIVTCGWHLPRARARFEAEGLEVAREISAGDAARGWTSRAWILGKERLLRALER
jgi:uncharacterized SAM-binding protein YcdF (DUF218 family)